MSETSGPGETTWPAGALEFLGACLLCGSSGSRALYEGLEDRNFFAAPGMWNLQQCVECGLARLDPRPSRDTIAAAYSAYYTHAAVPPERPSSNVRQALTNGFLNARYGYELSPASQLGVYILPLVPGRRRRALSRVRHLPKPGKAAELLDIGCGDGRFLRTMRGGGWTVRGIEPDSHAAELARETGLEVREGMFPETELAWTQFDAINLDHTLEHLHDPLAALREAFRLLKPGGLLSIATPNLNSAGHRRFGRHWVHLDPPRHLTIFDPATLRFALEGCGFSMRVVAPSPLTPWTYDASAAVAAGVDPFDPDFVPPRSVRLRARLAAAGARVLQTRAEELAVVARRPTSNRS